MAQVAILHGWSDTSASFDALARFLGKHGYKAVEIWLGDYLSLEDDVRVEDVGKRMEEVVRDLTNQGKLDKTFTLIVHSTGGLVAREWISAYYSNDIAKCPARRLIMLAPANFGSPLASMGKSLLGRVVKGWNNWFHTGTEMLNALELSSPYQWDLAQRDLFVPEGAETAPALYGPDGVWPFVIVGTHPYPSGLRKIVNENGSDGTVRVAAANLNTRGITVDFAADEAKPELTLWKLRQAEPFPFAVLPDRTHGSIISPDESDIPSSDQARARLGELILSALNCEKRDDYQAMVGAWNAISESTAALLAGPEQRRAVFNDDDTAEHFHQYMQINARVVDDHGAEVKDYFLEFSGPEDEPGDESATYFHREVLEDVHVNALNGALRCLYVDRTDLIQNYYDKIRGAAEKILTMSVSASPPGPHVSYFSDYKTGATGALTVHRQQPDAEEPRWLQRNMTHFVKIIIPRRPAEGVFKLEQYQP